MDAFVVPRRIVNINFTFQTNITVKPDGFRIKAIRQILPNFHFFPVRIPNPDRLRNLRIKFIQNRSKSMRWAVKYNNVSHFARDFCLLYSDSSWTTWKTWWNFQIRSKTTLSYVFFIFLFFFYFNQENKCEIWYLTVESLTEFYTRWMKRWYVFGLTIA